MTISSGWSRSRAITEFRQALAAAPFPRTTPGTTPGASPTSSMPRVPSRSMSSSRPTTATGRRSSTDCPTWLRAPRAALGRHGYRHQLDLRGRVEQAPDLQQGHGWIVASEVPPVGFTHFLRQSPVFGNVRDEDLHADQVLRMCPCGLESVDDVSGSDIELLGHGGTGDRSIRSLRRLPGEVDSATRLRNDRVGEARGIWQRLRVSDLVRTD